MATGRTNGLGQGFGLPSAAIETISGLSAGFLSTLVCHPLDLVKTRLQVDRSPGPRRFGATLQVVRDALKEGAGYKALYRGMVPNMVGSMASWGLYFMLYGELKTLVSSHPSRSSTQLSSTDYLATATTAGVLTAILTNPIWIVKTRMLATSANTPGAYIGFTQGLRSIIQTDGPRGLMRGLVPAMFGVSHGAFQFMFYENLKDWRMNDGTVLASTDFVVLSAVAKTAANLLTYPYRVIQARVQNFDRGVYKGPADAVIRIAREEGRRGFYKGLAPNLLRVLPNTCITFLVYENCRKYLR